jgi:hypothetical protein
MQADLRHLNRHIAISVSHAKAKWYAQICSKIHNMRFNPHVAWEHIRLLAKGKTAHHKKSMNMAMQLPDGTRVTNASKNMSVFGPHFNRVFNNNHPINPSVLQHVPQCRTLLELNASEVETKVLLMGHPGLSCHVPVVRSIFILLIPKYHLEIFVRFTLLCMYYHLINFLIVTL